jgi:homoprotocatechuate degradation regulator HpaR
MPPRIRRFSESLPMLLLKAREVAMQYFRPGLHAQGITEQQWRVLRALNEVRESSASGLAAECLIRAPSITRMLRKLASNGLVLVRNSQSDRRELRVKLTRKGKRLIDVIGPVSERQYDLIRDRMHPERMAQLYELLHDFIARERAAPKP